MAKKQLSAGAVLYRRASAGVEFLLLKNAKGHWDFPKGHMEKGETSLEACRREVREESGIRRFSLVPGFSAERSWAFREDGARVVKKCRFYLGRVSGGRIRLSPEHTKGGWYPASGALGKLGYPGQRSLVRLALRRIPGARP